MGVRGIREQFKKLTGIFIHKIRNRFVCKARMVSSHCHPPPDLYRLKIIASVTRWIAHFLWKCTRKKEFNHWNEQYETCKSFYCFFGWELTSWRSGSKKYSGTIQKTVILVVVDLAYLPLLLGAPIAFEFHMEDKYFTVLENLNRRREWFSLRKNGIDKVR